MKLSIKKVFGYFSCLRRNHAWGEITDKSDIRFNIINPHIAVQIGWKTCTRDNCSAKELWKKETEISIFSNSLASHNWEKVDKHFEFSFSLAIRITRHVVVAREYGRIYESDLYALNPLGRIAGLYSIDAALFEVYLEKIPIFEGEAKKRGLYCKHEKEWFEDFLPELQKIYA